MGERDKKQQSLNNHRHLTSLPGSRANLLTQWSSSLSVATETHQADGTEDSFAHLSLSLLLRVE